jgi:iron complex outermembrane receptor protein
VAGGIVTNFLRLFGNAEWRVAPDWILNAGAMAERISDGGDTLSPRLMLNWQASEGQTLRAGISTASRPPSAYEKYTDVKYYDRNGNNPLVWRVNDGQLQPERVLVRELGYFAKLPKLSLTADVRVFDEAISNGIANNRPDPPADPEIFKNSEVSTNQGVEYQVNYQPTEATRIFWSQTWTEIKASASIDHVRMARTEGGAAPRAASLAVFHSPAPGWQLSLGYHLADGVALNSADGGQRYNLQRTDVRIAKAFRLGTSKSELALTVQNLGPSVLDGDRKFNFDQRALLSMRIEY